MVNYIFLKKKYNIFLKKNIIFFYQAKTSLILLLNLFKIIIIISKQQKIYKLKITNIKNILAENLFYFKKESLMQRNLITFEEL